MKRSLLTKVLLKSVSNKNTMAEEFNTIQFAELFKNFMLQNEIITNEAINLQSTITDMRQELDDTERLSYIEELNIFELNPANSDESGSSGDSAIKDIAFQGYEMKPLKKNRKKIIAEEIEKDIIYYFNLIDTVRKKEKYARRLLYCLPKLTKHNFKTFAYLLRIDVNLPIIS